MCFLKCSMGILYLMNCFFFFKPKLSNEPQSADTAKVVQMTNYLKHSRDGKHYSNTFGFCWQWLYSRQLHNMRFGAEFTVLLLKTTMRKASKNSENEWWLKKRKRLLDWVLLTSCLTDLIAMTTQKTPYGKKWNGETMQYMGNKIETT